MTTVRLWTLIGQSGSGKSRSIKTLASREEGGPPGLRDILLPGGGFLRTYAKVMAWQEDRKMPADCIAEIEGQIATVQKRLGDRPPYAVNVLSALRFDPVVHSPTLTCPSANVYLAAWIDRGWELQSIVLMSPSEDGKRDFYGSFGAPTVWIEGSRDKSPGEMVGLIRNHFGWA